MLVPIESAYAYIDQQHLGHISYHFEDTATRRPNISQLFSIPLVKRRPRSGLYYIFYKTKQHNVYCLALWRSVVVLSHVGDYLENEAS